MPRALRDLSGEVAVRRCLRVRAARSGAIETSRADTEQGYIERPSSRYLARSSGTVVEQALRAVDAKLGAHVDQRCVDPRVGGRGLQIGGGIGRSRHDTRECGSVSCFGT